MSQVQKDLKDILSQQESKQLLQQAQLTSCCTVETPLFKNKTSTSKFLWPFLCSGMSTNSSQFHRGRLYSFLCCNFFDNDRLSQRFHRIKETVCDQIKHLGMVRSVTKSSNRNMQELKQNNLMCLQNENS